MIKNIIIKLINLPQLIKFLRQPKDLTKRWDPKSDLDLELYSKIFNHQNLHYGVFKEKRHPKFLSFADVENAMDLYTRLVVKKTARYRYILDVGCGNGVILQKLSQNKKRTLGLTPNQEQFDHITQNFPRLKVIKSTFEDLKTQEIPEIHDLEAILMAESFQYLPLEETLKKIAELSSKNRKKSKKPKKLAWIVFDYFRISEKTQNDSGHDYHQFRKALKEFRFTIEKEEDFTDQVLPTLGYVHFLASTFAKPLFTHFKKNLAYTNPLANYLLSETLEKQINQINLNVVDPQFFKKEKKYLFLKIKPNP